MTSLTQSSCKNRLLATIEPASFDRLAPNLERVDLPTKSVLIVPRRATRHVFFLERGVCSIIAEAARGRRIEVGLSGWEGMIGSHVLLGVDHVPYEVLMQVPGSALRIEVEHLKEATRMDEALRGMLLRGLHCANVQVAYTALANGRYSLNQRLARWLLMCHDRTEGDQLPLTHEFLALMLGVRRAGVTDELHIIEGLRAVKARRGDIQVLDRQCLERLAADSYGVPEQEYERLMGQSPRWAAIAAAQ